MASIKNLTGEIERISSLEENDVDEMYKLMTSYNDDVDRKTFLNDLYEKRDVILLRNSLGKKLKGFSTLMLLEQNIDGNDMTALFSGDTIIDKNYWGENELARMWGRYAFSLIDEFPDKELYWFLMSKGYKTYRFLPVFFNEFYPRRDLEFPDKEKRILDVFAFFKFGENYDPKTGIISFDGKKDHLKGGVADITESRKKNPDIEYFEKKNPNWARGDELACIIKLTKDNFNKMAQRIIEG